MEQLTLQDGPPPGPSAPPPPGQAHNSSSPMPPMQHMQRGPPQLPPQMFTTAAQLLDLTDKKLMVALRDGRKLIGILRSWDQFANLVLQSTTERIYAQAPPRDSTADTTGSIPVPKNLFCDVDRGTFLVRGENVLLLGEIDLDREDTPPEGYERGDVRLVHRLAKEERAAREQKDKRRLEKLRAEGFEGENAGEVLLL